MKLFNREKILVQRESLYNRIVITEEDNVRYLRFGNRILQSAVYVDDTIAMRVDYTKYMPLGLAFRPESRDVLLIGLGAGAIPRLQAKHCPHIRVDAVEIDQMVVDLAKEYLHLSENPGYNIIVTDGRRFLKRSNKRYDIIMIDAYNAEYIPYHLTTVEFLHEAKSRLSEGGVMVANLWSSNEELYLSMVKTYEEVFDYIHRFRVWRKNNVILVAAGEKISPQSIAERASEIQDKFHFPYDFVRTAKHLDTGRLDTSSAELLTDESAPDNWLKRKRMVDFTH